METFRLTSKLNSERQQCVIETTNDSGRDSISTVILIDGNPAETIHTGYEAGIEENEVLSLVKATHSEAKETMETLIAAYRESLVTDDARVQTMVGAALFYKRIYHDAADILRAAIRNDPENHRAFDLLGQVEMCLGNASSAITAAASAVGLQPTFADYQNHLGLAHLAGRSYTEAMTAFREAARINMYYADAYYNLGLALILDAFGGIGSTSPGDTINLATQQFDRALVVDADLNSQLVQQGLAALRDSNLEEAYRSLQGARDEYLEQRRRQDANSYVNQVLCRFGHRTEALARRIAALRGEIEQNPTYVDLIIELAETLLEQAQASWADGLQQFQAALDKNSSLTRVRASLDQAENIYGDIETVVRRIGQKG